MLSGTPLPQLPSSQWMAFATDRTKNPRPPSRSPKPRPSNEPAYICWLNCEPVGAPSLGQRDELPRPGVPLEWVLLALPRRGVQEVAERGLPDVARARRVAAGHERLEHLDQRLAALCEHRDVGLPRAPP